MTGLAFIIAAILIFTAGVIVGSAGMARPFWAAVVWAVDVVEDVVTGLAAALCAAVLGWIYIARHVGRVAASWGKRHANRKRARHLSAAARVGLAGTLH